MVGIKNSVNKNLLVFIFLIVFIILIVIGINALESTKASDKGKDKELPQLVKKYNSSREFFQGLTVYDYVDNSTNSRFKVQIIKFEDNAKLNSWIKNKVEENSGNLEVNGQIVFIDKNKKYVFWRNNNIFIQIITGNTSDLRSVLDLRQIGSGEFNIPLIRNYLLEYSSGCTLTNKCIIKSSDELLNEKIKEGLKWFENPPDDVKNSNY